ncbi:MAG TPA: hypothetical protein VL977_05445 [Solirubrobacteraceae bacterium]|nr:hypothetical protein [Solirubrobacteraceae bacterium]
MAAAEHAAATREHGAVERTLTVGAVGVRLRFAGAGLADALLPAFGPRIGGGGDAPARIDLWEETAVPGGHAPAPWSERQLEARGLVRGPRGSGLFAVEEGSGTITLVDAPARVLRYRAPSAERLPWWERAAPMRPALFWALGGHGRYLLHGAAVGDERGGVLLVGAGGSGKTTLAVAAAAAGLRYVGDDYVLIDAGPPPRALNLYATAKLDDGHLARFPELDAFARAPAELEEEDEKHVIDVREAWPGALTEELVLRAVAVPRIVDGAARLRAASPGAALLGVAPSTVMQMPYDGGAILSSLARLTRALPCFAISVGDDREALAGVLDELLELASGREPAGAPR